MTVARATQSDVPELCNLLAILFSHEAEFRPDAAKQSAGLAAIIGDPSVGVILKLVRESAGSGEGYYGKAGKIVGMVNILFVVSTYLGAKAALLEDMIVHPEHRGSGAGAILLQAAIEEATHAGCKRITLLTDNDNALARRFYEKAGFSASSMVPYRLLL